MASSIIALAPGAWVQVTTTDKEGSILHKSGGTVVYVEAAAPPAIVEPIATIKTTLPGDEFQYYGIAAGDNLYALAVNDTAEIVKAPRGA